MESKALPVILRKFVFQDSIVGLPDSCVDQDIDANQDLAAVRLLQVDASEHIPAAIPGYFVMSSAPPNIETAADMDISEVRKAAQGVRDIAKYLY
ncbi:MAG: hypothetical protein AAGA83_23940, partial [Cyanobacteria bacterium P01_F01_bin.116]